VHNANDATVYPLAPGAGPARTVTFPPGWLAADATTLDGAYAHAFADENGDRHAQPGEEIGRTADGDFKYPLHDFTAQVRSHGGPDGCGAVMCTWDAAVPGSWRVNREADTVQAFYLTNVFHDHLAEPGIGFVPPFAFEKATGDAVTLSADQGAATAPGDTPNFGFFNNATMDTPPQGRSPNLNMFLFKSDTDFDPHLDVNGGDDALVLWHEYTHGLTSRLITTADGVAAVTDGQAAALGEGWSDWYALDFADREGLMVDDPDVDGDMYEGAHVDLPSAQFPGGHVSRSQGIDCAVGVGSPDPLTNCPGSGTAGAGGYTLGDFFKVAPLLDVHADGEIWGETLWDVRRALIEHTRSDDAGARLAEELITEGLRLSPPNPTFLEGRDAILAADRALQLGLQDTLWQVFARRGMGFYAGTTSVSDREPVEDFNVPPASQLPNGTLTGTVTDSQSGAPIADVAVNLGPLNTKTDAAGRYTLSVVQGRYPRLRFTAGGYDQSLSTPFTVAPAVTAVHDIKLVRDWAASAGGATISDASVGDEDGGGSTCGPAAMIAQDDAHGWEMINPTPLPPEEPSQSKPFAIVKLPRAIDVDHIGIDPSARCLGGNHPDQSASLRDYRLQVSQDGRTFRPFKGDGNGTFGTGDLNRLNLIAPDGDNGRGVRFVRIDPLEPQDETCGFQCEGSFLLDIGQLEVYGTPSGGESPAPSPAPAATPEPARPVATPAPTPAPASAKPTAKIPASGRRGRITIAVSCSCTVRAKLVASAATARRDRLRRRTLAVATKTLRASATVTLRLSPGVLHTLARLHKRSIAATVTVVAAGTTVERTVEISR
jgi:hypothetical protein